jgi:hypothetical protein
MLKFETCDRLASVKQIIAIRTYNESENRSALILAIWATPRH